MLAEGVVFGLINDLLRVLYSALDETLVEKEVGCDGLDQGDGLVALDGLGEGLVLLDEVLGELIVYAGELGSVVVLVQLLEQLIVLLDFLCLVVVNLVPFLGLAGLFVRF